MTSQQNSKYSMYLAIKNVCDRHSSVHSDHEAFTELYTQWTGHLEIIRSVGQFQATRKTGVAEDKQQLRQEMCEAALEIASATRACAVASKKRELAERVKFSRSSLFSGRDIDSAKNCQNIHVAATANLAAIKPYGVTTAMLNALKDKIEAYSASLPQPRVSIVTGKSATRKLAAEFKSADELLNEGLDKLLPQFKADEPAFVADYFNARKLVASASSSKSASKVTLLTQPQTKAA